jgi:head-tail adaptor
VKSFDLRDRVRFERRQDLADGFGNFEGDWRSLGEARASLNPTRGGETVIAGRLQGKASWDLWVQSSVLTRSIGPDDRVVDVRDPDRVFNIRWTGDLDGDRRWVLMQLEEGVAE